MREADHLLAVLGRCRPPSARLRSWSARWRSATSPRSAPPSPSWRASFRRADGSRAAIPEFPHQASEYVAALTGAGLRVAACLEPPLPEPGPHGDEEARVVAGLPGVIVWAARRDRPRNAAGRA